MRLRSNGAAPRSWINEHPKVKMWRNLFLSESLAKESPDRAVELRRPR